MSTNNEKKILIIAENCTTLIYFKNLLEHLRKYIYGSIISVLDISNKNFIPDISNSTEKKNLVHDYDLNLFIKKKYNIIIDFSVLQNLAYFEEETIIVTNTESYHDKIFCNILSEINNNAVNLELEDRVYICIKKIYKVIKGTPTINNIIKHINDATIQLNNLQVTNKDEIRANRFLLTRTILKYLKQDKKYFILPHVYPYIYVSKKVALIGNSKKILRNNFGEEIDQYSTIFRFNYAVVKDFEKYCGSKSDIRASIFNCITGQKYTSHVEGLVNDYTLFKNIDDLQCIIISLSKFSSNILKQTAKKNGVDNINRKYYNILWITENFNESVTYFCSEYKLQKVPQIGLGFTLLLIDIGIMPDLYGFDIECCPDNYGYYWSGEVVHNKLSSCHNIGNEHLILKKLSEDGHINLH